MFLVDFLDKTLSERNSLSKYIWYIFLKIWILFLKTSQTSGSTYSLFRLLNYRLIFDLETMSSKRSPR